MRSVRQLERARPRLAAKAGSAAALVLATATALAVACTTSTPPPSPERSPSPRIPSCITDADCVGGEACVEGVCVRPGIARGPEPCGDDCPAASICVDGACADAGADGGPSDACGGCPRGTICDAESERCEPVLLPPDPGSREIPEVGWPPSSVPDGGA